MYWSALKSFVIKQLQRYGLINAYSKTETLLEEWANCVAVTRTTWVDKPDHLEHWRYRYDPCFSDPECKHVIYNYIETEASLRERVKEHYTRQDK